MRAATSSLRDEPTQNFRRTVQNRPLAMTSLLRNARVSEQDVEKGNGRITRGPSADGPALHLSSSLATDMEALSTNQNRIAGKFEDLIITVQARKGIWLLQGIPSVESSEPNRNLVISTSNV